MAGKTSRRIIKILVGLGVIGILGFLMVRSVRDARATPYTIARSTLQGWTLTVQRASSPNDAVLVLQPPAELANGLFNQVFKRTMESMSRPAAAAIPLVLHGELDPAFVSRLTPEALMAIARDAGLGSAQFQPRCLGYRRVSERRGAKQLYFVLFDAPAFQHFRELLKARGASFDPAALSPVLMVAVAESDFSDWLPLRADPKADCVAPIVTTDS
jgi:hypothetical protein